jgi:16S rRNA U516 pseudouridylate synthase RsuA-like enzyme
MAWTRTYDQPEPQRVNRWLAQAGVCSRREAERWIEEGRVKVGGKKITTPAFNVSESDAVTIDGSIPTPHSTLSPTAHSR